MQPEQYIIHLIYPYGDNHTVTVQANQYKGLQDGAYVTDAGDIPAQNVAFVEKRYPES